MDILFLGDSITDGWHWDTGGKNLWAKHFAPRHAANFGIGYDRIQNVLWRIENGELDGISPEIVILLIGTNNAGNEDNGRPRNTTPEIIEGVSNLVTPDPVSSAARKSFCLAFFRAAKKTIPFAIR